MLNVNEIAGGADGIAVGRDTINSILVSGDGNRAFIGNHRRMRDAYLILDSVFKRVRLDRFVTRAWLAGQKDDLLAQNEQGPVVLETGNLGRPRQGCLSGLPDLAARLHPPFCHIVPGSGQTNEARKFNL